MTRCVFALILASAALAAVGCGGETVLNTAPLTDEQKKAIQEEDKRVAEEEGGKPVKSGAGKPGVKK